MQYDIRELRSLLNVRILSEEQNYSKAILQRKYRRVNFLPRVLESHRKKYSWDHEEAENDKEKLK
jgi:hypothetical protein